MLNFYFLFSRNECRNLGTEQCKCWRRRFVWRKQERERKGRKKYIISGTRERRKTGTMGRKKIQITRIMDERNRQVSGVNFFGIIIYMDCLLHFPLRYVKGIESILSLSIKKRFSELNVIQVLIFSYMYRVNFILWVKHILYTFMVIHLLLQH